MTTNQNIITLDAWKLAAVSLAVSNEETRYYLNGIYFDGNCAVATDGHILTCADGVTGIGDDSLIVPVSKKLATACKHKAAWKAIYDGELWTVYDHMRHGDCAIRHIESAQAIDATYPDWRRVVPQDIGQPTNAAFSEITTGKLVETAKIIKKQFDGAVPLRLWGEPGSDDAKEASGYPHTCTYGRDDLFSAVMPMRAEPEQSMPDFHKYAVPESQVLAA